MTERVVKRYPVKGTSRFGVPGPIKCPEGGAIYDCRTTSEAIQASFRGVAIALAQANTRKTL
jgi:hypothetical protein